jgi:chromate transporter
MEWTQARRGIVTGTLEPGRPDGTPRPQASLPALFGVCGKVSLLSFGGGSAALLRREVVETREWVADADFYSGYSIAQAMPGNNITNLSIWVGYQLRGTIGAVVACLGIWVPSGLLIIVLGSVLHQLGQTGWGAIGLAGVAAAAIGLSLNMGLRTTRFALRNPACIAVFCAVLLSSALHQSVVLILVVLAPISIAVAYWQDRP